MRCERRLALKAKREQIDLIIEHLEHAKLYPAMYFGSLDDTVSAQSYLFGIQQVSFLLLNLDMYSYSNNRGNIVNKRGYRYSPRGVSIELKNEGLTDEEIVQELLQIEIEVWQLYLEELEEV